MRGTKGQNLKKRITKSTKGITLIALVVTIIVLLILAGVSIAMLTGNNGILSQAGRAKKETNDAADREMLQLAVMSSFGTDGKIDINKLKTEVEEIGGEISGTTFPVTISKGNISLEVQEDGKYTEIGTVPQIEYQLAKTDGTKIQESETLEEDSIKLKISISNMKDLQEIKSITLKTASGTTVAGTVDLNKGTMESEITENGKYVVTVVATNDKGKEVSNSKTITISGKIKVANMPDSWQQADGSNSQNDWYAYKDTSTANGSIANVNAPKLAEGMTAIKYVAGSDTSTYETLTAGSKWANAMTKDGSMWVWIPRYAYKITSGYHQSGSDINSTDGTLGAGTIEIAFLDEQNNFLNGETGDVKTSIADVTYTNNQQNEWLLAPGFTFGTEEISGFWFAKYEASNTDGYGSSSTTDNTGLTLQIKPNVTSWRNITSKNMFTVCQNLKNKQSNNELIYFNKVDNVDTHMTKNVEWGAVAYLAHSKYGLNGQEIAINTKSSYTTGIGSGSTTSTASVTNKYNTPTGITASTTKNVYGIYDMSGGASEYVAGCYTNNTNYLTDNADTSYQNKYIDVYSSYNNSKYGDAVYETSSSKDSPYTNSWFSDYSSFVNSGYPVFGRGGHYYSGSDAGLFFFAYSNGIADYSYGFRPVCVVK